MATQTSFLGLTKQDGTEKNHRPVINANYDIEDAFASGISEALAIVVNGNTAPQAIAAGQYLFIKNHSTLATGGYHAKSAISSGATISSSNVDPDADGIANSLYANLVQFAEIDFEIPSTGNTKTLTLPSGFTTSNSFPVAHAIMSDAWYWNRTADSFIYFAGNAAVFYYTDNNRGRSAKVIFCKPTTITTE